MTQEKKIEPILEGAYLQITGRMSFKDGMLDFPSIEIIGFNQEKETFPSTAFSNMGEGPGEAPVLYAWYVENDGTLFIVAQAPYTAESLATMVMCSVMAGGRTIAKIVAMRLPTT